jgi:hypothetical protein
MKVRDVPRGKRKPNNRLQPAHLAFIRKLSCVRCGTPWRIEAAHVRIGTDGGTGLKPSDCYAVPLCGECHTTGIGAQHRCGELTFWSRLRVDPLALAASLWAVSGDITAGERIVTRARYVPIDTLAR